jgi:hypothetical protein
MLAYTGLKFSHICFYLYRLLECIIQAIEAKNSVLNPEYGGGLLYRNVSTHLPECNAVSPSGLRNVNASEFYLGSIRFEFGSRHWWSGQDFRWFFMTPSGKFWDSTSIRPRSLPSKYFPIYRRKLNNNKPLKCRVVHTCRVAGVSPIFKTRCPHRFCRNANMSFF